MQENEFEKKLQQKMDELQVQPAEELWPKIKAEVAKRNGRRRRFIFFFLLAAMLFAGLLLTDIFKGKGKNDSSIAATQLKNQIDNTATANTGLANSNEPVKQAVNEPVQQSTAVVAKSLDEANTLGQKPLAVTNHIGKTAKIKGTKKGAVKMNVAGGLQDEMESEKESSAGQQYNEVVNTAVVPDTIDEEKKSTTKDNSIEKDEVKKEVVINEPAKKETIKPQQKTAGEAVKTGKKKNSNSWNIAFSLTVGRSSTGNSYLTDKSLAAYQDNVGNSAGSPGSYLYTPSSTKPGFAFAAGIKLVRNLSAHNSIAAGLQYAAQNTLINTGERVYASTAVRDVFFTQGSTKSYTNHYHFISIPVSFSTSVLHIGKSNLNLEAGMSLSRLISTNALNFNTTQGLYYPDNSLFNKTIVGLSAAASINLFPASKFSFSAGPEFTYSLTPLASAGMYSKSHYSFLGIRLQKNLKK